MKEQEGNQRNTPGVQPLLSLRHSELKPRFPSSDTLPLSAIQKQKLSPSRSVAQLQPEGKPADTTPLTNGLPLTTQATTEHLPAYPEAVLPQSMPPRLRRSREKTTEVSLEEVPLLNSYEQYMSELRRVKRLKAEAEESVVARAKTGDQEAKNALIENCLGYVSYIARRYHVYVEHDDLLDIVQVGNLAITEKVDKALDKAEGSVGAYLCGVAKQSIRKYCLYRSRLMPVKDHNFPLEDAPTVESLEALTDKEASDNPVQIAATESDPLQMYLEKEGVEESLATLTTEQREVVEMRHGLTGERRMMLVDIARMLGLPITNVQSRYQRAIEHLRNL